MTAAFSIRMITIDCHEPGRLAAFWSAATDSPIVADHGAFAMVGSKPALGFQQVADPPAGKNRIHFDGGGTDREQLVNRFVALRAHEHETHSVPGLTWTVMSDPEGNVFCVGNPD